MTTHVETWNYVFQTVPAESGEGQLILFAEAETATPTQHLEKRLEEVQVAEERVKRRVNSSGKIRFCF